MERAIRAASKDDILALYEISCQAHLDEVYRTLIPAAQYETFRHTYTPNAARRESFSRKMTDAIESPQANVWVAETQGGIVGYTVAGLRGVAWVLQGLFVRPDYQGRGIGRQLFQTSCRAAPAKTAIELTVIADSQRAVRMYSQEGFKIVRQAEVSFFGAVQNVMRYQAS